MVNLVLLPLWTITEGTRRRMSRAWIFFVSSLFTSLAFSVALRTWPSWSVSSATTGRWPRRAPRNRSCNRG